MKEWIYNKLENKSDNLINKLLLSRGITNPQDIEEFLNPLSMNLTQPDVFNDMNKAVKRISDAIEYQEKIVIYGDFDADGVTSTSLLYKTLLYLGGNVSYFIPDREKEGHGFDTKALVKLMASAKPKLMISVDCGISNVSEVNFIKSFGIDVIITDHHEAPDELPDAYAIINPKSPNALNENLSTKKIKFLTSLAGVGVAFKLAQALLQLYDKLDFIPEILPFVAVGTVADVVPLIGENRYFVLKGIELIEQGKHYGLKRLIESAGYKIEQGLTSETIAFGVAPRINASGRLETVESALKVLISDSKPDIEMAVQNLNELNKVRQTICQDIFEQADDMLKKEGNKNPAIILFNPDWQVGIIGIVASKLVEKYYKPTFLMTYSEETKQIKCSARSIEGVHLYEVISEIGEMLDGFGGHSLAAGLYFTPEKTPFKTVKEQLNKIIKEVINGKKLKPFINIDLDLSPDNISVDLVENLAKLEPFGASNPNPIFTLRNCKLKEKKLMGDNKNHLRMILENEGKTFTAIRWKEGDINLSLGDELDIAFHPRLNEFNDNTYVQLIVDDIHSPNLKEDIVEDNASIKIYDHRKKTDILPQVNDYVKSSKLNIKIFAENKQIKDELSKYDGLSENVVSRNELSKCDSIMLFDYPADKETLNYIIETAKPKALHLMNYNIKTFEDNELIKLLGGMIKFAYNNNSGKIDLIRCASFLGKSVTFIKQVFALCEDCNVFKIKEQTDDYYIITDYIPENLPAITHNPNYQDICSLAEECELFQKSLLEDELSDIISNLC